MVFQIGSGLLEACLLAVLSKEDTYGYVLTQRLRAALAVSESTLYPILRRLQKSGYLSTYDQPFQGRNRRYYAITAQGRVLAAQYKEQWTEFKMQVDNLMLGEDAL